MAVGYWRRDPRARPAHYRTPSPPRACIEVLTPNTSPLQETTAPHRGEPPASGLRSNGASSTHHAYIPSHHHRDSNGSGLDLFASIAIATDDAPARGQHARKRSAPTYNHTLQEDGRMAKKAKLTSYDGAGRYTSTVPTPSTASEPTEVRQSDAELLLHFSKETHLEHQRSASLASEKMLSPTFLGRGPQTYAPVFDESPQQTEMKTGFELNGTHGTMQNGVAGYEENTVGDEQVALVGQLDHSNARDQVPIPQEPAPRPQSVHDGHMAAAPNDQGTSNVLTEVNGDAKAQEGVGHLQPASATANQPSMSTEAISTSQAPVPSPMTNGFLHGVEEAANSIRPDTSDPLPEMSTPHLPQPTTMKAPKEKKPSVCAACNQSGDEGSSEAQINWITCEACQAWFHFGCAGLPPNPRGARAIDKFRCKACEEKHGLKTTYVRKSGRAHSTLDYAAVNEGIPQTSEDTYEHHYVRLFKEGKIKFQPENFQRMRPEDVTPEFLGRPEGWTEPIVIPAALNPRPKPREAAKPEPEASSNSVTEQLPNQSAATETPALEKPEADSVSEAPAAALTLAVAPPPVSSKEDPDGLEMVMPHDLTVRQVAELYGPEEKVEVIYVKSQNGEDKPWNMRRWADYYENPSKKVIRNVISLEVSHSALGQLIERPKVVRQLDLQDSIWPDELKAKGEYPKVQVYCLMSVADCFTDFHIDFGGSSVFYHILKGQKTFFFIPPHEKHLKKYEDWCNSPQQNVEWLGDLTKECYRVDLFEGDTALIPAGWIHSVWTPTDSLVIGGNFLTRLHYEEQIRVTKAEKATKVARKFRYPHFQKIQWLTALRYLDEDPLPDSVRDLLISGEPFRRETLTYEDSDPTSGYVPPSPEYAHKRHYPKAELDGLYALGAYLLRTVRIVMGCIDEQITVTIRNAVKKAIPKTAKWGEPLDAVKTFAMWCAWKQGNETLPDWAKPGVQPEATAPEFQERKPGPRTQRRLEREAAYQAFKVAPERQSTRARAQPQSLLAEITAQQQDPAAKKASPAPPGDRVNGVKRKADDAGEATPKKKLVSNADGKGLSPRGRACEACRKARRGCKHRDLPRPATPTANGGAAGADPAASTATPAPATANGDAGPAHVSPPLVTSPGMFLRVEVPVRDPPQLTGDPAPVNGEAGLSNGTDGASGAAAKAAGRGKACETCRRSKVSCPALQFYPMLILRQRRCIHDEYGNQDPVKLAEAAIPRPAAKKRRLTDGPESPNAKKVKMQGESPRQVKSSPVRQTEPLASAPEPVASQAPLDAIHVAPSAPISAADATLPNGEHHEQKPAVLEQFSEGVRTGSTSNNHPSPPTANGHGKVVSNGYEQINDTIPGQETALPNGISAHSPTSTSPPDDEVHLIATEPEPFADPVKLEPAVEETRSTITVEHDPTLHTTDPTDHAAAVVDSITVDTSAAAHATARAQQLASSSLVSPPDSTQHEADEATTTSPHSARPNGRGPGDKSGTPSSSRPASRRSSGRSATTGAKSGAKSGAAAAGAALLPRTTPESGPARRGSVASVAATTDGRGASMSPATPGGTTTAAAWAAAAPQQPRKSRASAELGVEDEASRKLIRAMQAEELGLRRRRRA